MSKPETRKAEKGIRLVDLIHKANGGDKESLSVLRSALESDYAGSLMEIAGNLACALRAGEALQRCEDCARCHQAVTAPTLVLARIGDDCGLALLTQPAQLLCCQES